MEKIRKLFTDGKMALLGSCIILMVNGCVFLQNHLENYLKSWFFKTFDKQGIKEVSFDKIYFLLMDEIGIKLGYLIGAMMFNFLNLHVKNQLSIAIAIQMVGFTSAIFVDDYKTALTIFNCLFSFGSGISTILCVQCLYEHYYDSRGPVVGLLFSAYSLGQFVFNVLATQIINPNGIDGVNQEAPDESSRHRNTWKYYETLDKIPVAIVLINIIFLIMLTIGVFLTKRVTRQVKF